MEAQKYKTGRMDVMKNKRALILVVLVLSASLCGCQSAKLDQANRLIEESNYSSALEILESLESNEDVASSLDECKYQLGMEQLNQKNWESALNYFSSMSAQETAEDEISQCNYELGVQAMENSEWDTAMTYFENCPYQDSSDLLAKCEKEKGMSEKADRDFLSDIAASVKERSSLADGSSQSELVNVELAHLEKYRNAEFYDARLEELASLYFEGLDEQKSVVNEIQYADEQIMWQTGLVDRYTALVSLYEEYGLLQDDEEFIANYVLDFDEQKKKLDAYNEIENDLVSQIGENSEKLKASFDGLDVTVEFTNNTPHEYSLGADFSFTDSNGTVSSQNSVTTGIIKPGATFKLEVYVPSYDNFYGFEFETFFVSVVPGEKAESEASLN